MITYRPHVIKPDNQICQVFDLKYNLLGEFIGKDKTSKFIGTDLASTSLSSNTRKIIIDKRYYVTKESFFTQNLFI
jgi:hypothetical protein